MTLAPTDNVVTRFAPSPTGYLHIGGVRTALYSWLWARKHGGRFILRIEDTDAARSTDESIQVILESMKWLGLDWDEGPEVGGDHGPYFQTKRLDLYAKYAEKLIASGHAFRCYASKEEIAAAREEFTKAGGKGFKFRSPWRDRSDGDPSAPHVVRFRAPTEGSVGWDDVVKGRIDVPNKEQQDFILLRESGLPLYNFGCAVDDHSMGVTLVTRGDDHVINTPQQILIYEALGASLPAFAHLPMVLAPNGQKLSKRHAAVGVLEYRDLGYVPDGVLNYLARLGWSHGDQEIFSRAELVEHFDWAHVGSTAGKYDGKKFTHVQSQQLRAIDDSKLAELVVPFLAKRGVEVTATDARLAAAIGPVQLRCATLAELAEGLDYFFLDDDALTYEEKGKKKFLTPEMAPNLEKLLAIVESEAFTEEALEAAVNAWVEAAELKMKVVAQPARMALTGRTRSPGLYETMTLLGRERVVARLQKGIALAQANTGE